MKPSVLLFSGANNDIDFETLSENHQKRDKIKGPKICYPVET